MRFVLIFFLFISLFSFGQLPKSVDNLIGEWKFKTGSGLETWEMNGEELKGKEIRINKLGDSIVVEEMTIRFINEQFVYTIEEHKMYNDTVVHHYANRFVSKNRKMNFLNIDSNIPVSISYRFGFLNKRKVKIKIQFSPNEKPVKLLMYKNKM